jgi:uncharacterized metal-binding protein
MGQACEKTTAPKLIFSCSGVADVGEVADLTARKLNREGSGKMYCLTGIGAELTNFIDYTKTATKIITIDGCPFDCAKKTLEKVGISSFECIRVTDFGLTKGKTDITDQTIETIAVQGRGLLQEVCFES